MIHQDVRKAASHLGQSQVVRSPIKFAQKYYSAHLLNARMFQGDARVKEMQEEIRGTSLAKVGDSKMQKVIQMSTDHLQQWVRATLKSDGQGTDRYKLFLGLFRFINDFFWILLFPFNDFN